MGAEDGEIDSLIVFAARSWPRLNIGEEQSRRARGGSCGRRSAGVGLCVEQEIQGNGQREYPDET